MQSCPHRRAQNVLMNVRNCTPGSSSNQEPPLGERGALSADGVGGNAALLCVTVTRELLSGTFSLDNHV